MLKPRYFLSIVFVLGLALSSTVAGEIIVTPTTPQDWAEANQAGLGASVISGDNPRSGTGSLDQSLTTPNSDKTDYQVFHPDTTFAVGEGVKATSNAYGLLGDLNAAGMDWYRDSSSTAPDHLTPAYRLYVWDPDAGGVHGTSYLLIWEGVYNGYPVTAPTDTWTVEDVLNQNFWRIPQFINGSFAGIGYCNSNPTECFVFDNTITDWGFGPNTVVLGVIVGLGSGWNGSYQSYVDNVTIGFSGDPMATTWNFELDAVPMATAVGLAGLATAFLGALLWTLRRRVAGSGH